MRHRKRTEKLGRTGSHRRCMIANMLKSLIEHGRVETSLAKAKMVRRYADKLITLAKANTLCSRRAAIALMMIRFNPLTSKEARLAKGGDESAYNTDRKVIRKLFGPMREQFVSREGGYTRIYRKDFQVGDGAPKCFLEYLPAEVESLEKE